MSGPSAWNESTSEVVAFLIAGLKPDAWFLKHHIIVHDQMMQKVDPSDHLI
jgi:hypothetical protein